MKAATQPVQRPADARLLVLRRDGTFVHEPRAALAKYVRAGDVIVANDAATMPASLFGMHERTASPIEVRLASWAGRALGDPSRFVAVVFGDGDYLTRTESRAPPPALIAGDRVTLGPLRATVAEVRIPPRLVVLALDGDAASIWAGIAQHGRPVQYAHMTEPLAMWDVWTPLAGAPAAFEPPSAGFVLDWQLQQALRARGAHIVTLTHAAGLSATGDDALDARLPLPERYVIPNETAEVVRGARGRVIAVGTTVVRALEHAASRGGLRSGAGIADQRIGSHTRLHVVDALLTGTHERGTSHFELMRAFASDASLAAAGAALDREGYRTHEFGDSMLVFANEAARRVENRAGAALAA